MNKLEIKSEMFNRKEMEKICKEIDNSVKIKSKTIKIKTHNDIKSTYNIPLSECNNTNNILSWVHHMCGKGWMTPEKIKRFIEVTAKVNNIKLYE